MQNEFAVMFIQFLGVLFIIFLAYIGTKWLSRRYTNLSRSNQMKVLERISLGQDKSIVLVSIGKKAYLLGVSAKGIDALQNFDEGDFIIPQEITHEKVDFSNLFNELSKKCNNLGTGIGSSIGSGIGSSIGSGINSKFASTLKDFYIKNGRKNL